jgi:TRAP-type mannitol/chloroaromatic compound transport system permease small subunit
MEALGRVLHRIETVSEWSGKLVSWLLPVLIGTVTYDVAMRYLFSAPTKWSYDVSYMLGGTVYVVGLAHILARKENVRVDIFYSRFSARTKSLVDTVFSLVFFFPLVVALFVHSVDQAWASWILRETSQVGWWHPPLYPFKAVLPIALLLLLMQGLATFVRDLLQVFRLRTVSAND